MLDPKIYANDVEPIENDDMMIPINVKSNPASFARTG